MGQQVAPELVLQAHGIQGAEITRSIDLCGFPRAVDEADVDIGQLGGHPDQVGADTETVNIVKSRVVVFLVQVYPIQVTGQHTGHIPGKTTPEPVTIG